LHLFLLYRKDEKLHDELEKKLKEYEEKEQRYLLRTRTNKNMNEVNNPSASKSIITELNVCLFKGVKS
jgi:hypothetical protein